jgi:hypothetical protein
VLTVQASEVAPGWEVIITPRECSPLMRGAVPLEFDRPSRPVNRSSHRGRFPQLAQYAAYVCPASAHERGFRNCRPTSCPTIGPILNRLECRSYRIGAFITARLLINDDHQQTELKTGVKNAFPAEAGVSHLAAIHQVQVIFVPRPGGVTSHPPLKPPAFPPTVSASREVAPIAMIGEASHAETRPGMS